jgi:hypothetical protein
MKASITRLFAGVIMLRERAAIHNATERHVAQRAGWIVETLVALGSSLDLNARIKALEWANNMRGANSLVAEILHPVFRILLSD